MIEETNKLILEYASKVNWKPKNIPDLFPSEGKEFPPFITNINKFFQKKCDEKVLLLPELRKDGNQSIGIYSDYGGEHKESHYYTYSVLICGFNHSYGLIEEMNKIREKYKLEKKEITFKDFSFGPIQRALNDYLITIDFMVVGLLYTIVVSKSIKSLFGIDNRNKRYLTDILNKYSLGNWEPKIAEKLLRIIHITAYLTALLSTNGQKIFWMTDEDAIAPNNSQHEKTIDVFKSILTLYTKNKYELIGGALPFKDKSTQFLDFLSITDITAGSIEQYFSEMKKSNNNIHFKEGAEKVLKWLCHDGIGLKKQTVVINEDELDNKNFIISDVKFNELLPSKDAHFIKF